MKRGFTLTLLAALLLVGCGAEDLTPKEEVAQAATKTTDTGSMRMSMSASIRLPGSRPVTTTGTGEFDAKTKRGRVQTKLPGAGAEIEVILDRTILYLRLPSLGLGPEAKPWVKVDLQQTGKELGLDFQALLELGQSDPTKMLDYLGATAGVEELGREQVRGVETTRYRATIDVERYAKLLEQKGAAESAEKIVELIGRKTIPMQVWIDADSLVRRFRLRQAIPGTKGSMTLTVEMYDFGAPVRIELPPAKDVMTLAELLKLGGE